MIHPMLPNDESVCRFHIYVQRAASCLGIALLLGVAASARAAESAPPKTGRPLTAVSDALNARAKQHAAAGWRLEQTGDYHGALQEYQAAIAERPIDESKPVNSFAWDPSPFLIRAGAEVDSARVLSKAPSPDANEVAKLLSRAEADFSIVLRIVEARPISPENQSVTLLQKATIGRAYARLMAGNLTLARKDLQTASARPGPEVPHIRDTLTGLDTKITQHVPPDTKVPALINLGIEVTKAFLPKYGGLAVAVGDVADAFRK